ncbi:J domain-containing protein [Pygmaiobacter massiliensis]|uniref:J domain-containing protein n=1 Tax=Pygmaiobacter massiliensis TaxID=1917873 RepID=UPI002A81A93A|nr:J domain-containing protein [Pygmaiobacter massiliensis]MDY4785229.1 J domain-containing protein [Pygmaiobacter massiliensis]
MRDPYEVLGLAPGASTDEIKLAYKKLAQKYSADNYAGSPLEATAKERLAEIDTAFDQLMGQIRTGGATAGSSAGQTAGAGTAYADIRTMINEGRADEAMSRLSAMPGADTDGEWNFLYGSALYYKGWLADAVRYFEKAVSLAPGNQEYQAAYNRLRNSANGNVAGNPYGGYQPTAAGCNCCDMCTALMCMDMCCGCGRGC